MSDNVFDVKRGQLLSAAKALAERGFRVFPLVEKGRVPLGKEFYTRASSDPARVESMWTEAVTDEPADHNIGVLTGEGMFVLDVDVKDGADGLSSLEFYEDIGLDTNTLTASTPSGGRHLFYRIPNDVYVSNSVKKIGNGLDVRGWHGFVVGVGSVTEKGAYRWLNDAPIIDAPEFLLNLIKRAKPAEKKGAQSLVELDQPEAISRAVFYLANEAPEAYVGNRSDTVYRVAARVMDFGVSLETAFELVSDHWNEFKCEPPLELGELLYRVENAWKYRNQPAGVSAPAADFEPVEIDAEDLGEHPDIKAERAEQEKAKAIYWLKPSQAREQASRPYLVKGLIDQGAMIVTYGESNVGKTNVVLDRALHIATGRAYGDRTVSRGAVVYVAAEGGVGIRRRIDAWFRKNHVPDPDAVPFALIPCAVDLLHDKKHVARLLEIVREVEAHWGEPVRYLVIDTLSRALSGGDENSSVDLGAFVKNCDALRAGTTATIDIIHHSGKDKARGARGHSLLRAATDTEFEVEKGVVRTTKQRDMDYADDQHFRLTVVELGTDEDGDPITSVVVETVDGEFLEIELTPAEEALHRIVMDYVAEKMADTGEKDSEIKFRPKDIFNFICCAKTVGKITDNGLSRPSVSEKLSVLVDKGALKKLPHNQYVIR